MPELVRWVSDHKYDGSCLPTEQKALRAFYSRLVNLTAEPAFRDGAFYPLNPENRDNPNFGRVGDETVSGHWCYSFLRFDRTAKPTLFGCDQSPSRINPTRRARDHPGGSWVSWINWRPATPSLYDRLASERPLSRGCTVQEISSVGVLIPEIAPLSAYYFECSTKRF